MNKSMTVITLMFLLSISFAAAAVVVPSIVPVDPVSGGKVSGNYTLKVDIVYPENQTGMKTQVRQVMFRYLVRQNCTQQCKVTIGNDLSDAFGWNVVWDTTQVPEGMYDLQYFAFNEGGDFLLAQALVKNITVDQSYQRPEETPVETNVTQPEIDTTNETETAPEINKTPEVPKNETKTPAPARTGFWAKLWAWIKSLFASKPK